MVFSQPPKDVTKIFIFDNYDNEFHKHKKIQDWLLTASSICGNAESDACEQLLKPMDSFGTWRKWKLFLLLFVNAEFYRVVWTINALLTVRSEMLPFSGNNQNIKMFGVPPNTLP